MQLDREGMAALFAAGADRKVGEREGFINRAFDDADSTAAFLTIAEFLELDIRYYRMAAAYYRGDLDSIGAEDQDLLVLASVRTIAPKLYARYLREIGPAAKEEKVTHKALEELKRTIAAVAGGI